MHDAQRLRNRIESALFAQGYRDAPIPLCVAILHHITPVLTTTFGHPTPGE